MIDVYSWPTPNGHKIHIMMEETGLPYRVHGVDIGRGDQFEPAFLKISPNNKIPAIVDSEGPDGKPISIFESAAILLYLADKTGKFMPKDARGSSTALIHHAARASKSKYKSLVHGHQHASTRSRIFWASYVRILSPHC